jgi:hypothetical protein
MVGKHHGQGFEKRKNFFLKFFRAFQAYPPTHFPVEKRHFTARNGLRPLPLKKNRGSSYFFKSTIFNLGNPLRISALPASSLPAEGILCGDRWQSYFFRGDYSNAIPASLRSGPFGFSGGGGFVI